MEDAKCRKAKSVFTLYVYIPCIFFIFYKQYYVFPEVCHSVNLHCRWFWSGDINQGEVSWNRFSHNCNVKRELFLDNMLWTIESYAYEKLTESLWWQTNASLRRRRNFHLTCRLVILIVTFYVKWYRWWCTNPYECFKRTSTEVQKTKTFSPSEFCHCKQAPL